MNMKFSPSPSNINYYWNFGSLIIMMLMIQFVSGIFISFHYNSSINYAFYSTIHISREVYFGWLIRLIHINGASMFFMLIFFHMIKAIYYSSWNLKMVWLSGIIILLLSMMIAFLGYVLPWGQMSFWAATVITNLLSIFPYFGKNLVELIWGSFSVSYPTLNRFFSFHFFIPFILLLIILIHILFLHMYGSSNTISAPMDIDKVMFDPYFSIKDILGMILIFMIFMLIMLVFPFYSMDSENFIEANPMITPIHIKPEWYFLFAYAILRCIPNKTGGVISLVMSIFVLFIKPFQMKYMNTKFFFMKKNFVFMYFINFLILTFLGGKMVEFPYDFMSVISTIFYFYLILMI